ncbi:hypothetical protein CUMW_181800 [Citrus unshiu]|uniref:Uncharacterized protein n=1 Tax=Citrus unshiu TaxID=55188 RepID=A0A2H5PZD3_CITUN|nr:hypothetical protein CUMW_181800 [Citrus unshiu]
MPKISPTAYKSLTSLNSHNSPQSSPSTPQAPCCAMPLTYHRSSAVICQLHSHPVAVNFLSHQQIPPNLKSHQTCNVKGLILNNLNFLLSYDIYGLHWHLKGEKTSIEVIKDIVQKCIEE